MQALNFKEKDKQICTHSDERERASTKRASVRQELRCDDEVPVWREKHPNMLSVKAVLERSSKLQQNAEG